MNRVTIDLNALQHNQYVIEVEESVRVKAARAVERMIAI